MNRHSGLGKPRKRFKLRTYICPLDDDGGDDDDDDDDDDDGKWAATKVI
jgi:hypothetical protein